MLSSEFSSFTNNTKARHCKSDYWQLTAIEEFLSALWRDINIKKKIKKNRRYKIVGVAEGLLVITEQEKMSKIRYDD